MCGLNICVKMMFERNLEKGGKLFAVFMDLEAQTAMYVSIETIFGSFHGLGGIDRYVYF